VAALTALFHEHDLRLLIAAAAISILGTLGQHCHAAIRASRELPSGQQALVIEGTRGTVACAAWRGVPQLELVLQDGAGRTVETFAPAQLFEREQHTIEELQKAQKQLLLCKKLCHLEV